MKIFGLTMRAATVAVMALGVTLGGITLLAQEGPGGGPGGDGPRGGGRGGMMGQGRGTGGTVTEATADHYVLKTEQGVSYTVKFNANTRIMRMTARPGNGDGRMGPGGTPPLQIKATDIKVGDLIRVMGEQDDTKKTIGAMMILQIDPEVAKQMREMQASFGKTWLGGKITAINETKITIEGSQDHAAHTFVVDENTTFRKRREPVTLADFQVGDQVRAEGAVKDGVFVAKAVQAGGGPGGPGGPGGGERAPRNGGAPPPQE